LGIIINRAEGEVGGGICWEPWTLSRAGKRIKKLFLKLALISKLSLNEMQTWHLGRD
jgi:hypothetical protein